MTHRSRTTMEALSAIHRTKRPPKTNPNLVYAIMGEIRTLDIEQARDFIRIAFPFSAVAGIAAMALFMLSSNTSLRVEDMLVCMYNGGSLVLGM
ncbi:hypothetical protein [Salidesulfovibrio onnuriiensis]|uniref:hypothetical protein n=1 Tax=Salidesulfovibrio onnuriiensis TaxID=2583823 RepID=UPI0011CBB6BD|nr:hypothetical protein [Salidesulfovibrio onnuriiensis]